MTIRFGSACCVLLYLFSPVISLACEALHSLRFAQTLQAEGDYYRAITEYKRALFLAPSDSTRIRETAILGIGGALFSGGEPGRSSEWLLAKLKDIDSETARVEGLHLMYRSLLASGNGSRLLSATREVRDSTAEASLYEGLALAQIGKWHEASRRFQYLTGDGRYGPTASAYLAVAREGERAEWKSPDKATVLGIIPGLGYWYAGHRQTALASLLVNAVFTGATIQAFRTEQNVLGGFLSLFTVSWYAGNIYGSSRAARRYNDTLQEDLWHRFEY